jgi:hypothetical protein
MTRNRDYLCGDEVTKFDPFGLSEPLTGKYNEPMPTLKPTHFRPRRSFSPRIRLEPCERRARNLQRYEQSNTDGKEYCPCCQCYIPPEAMTENPDYIGATATPRLCIDCAEDKRQSLHHCPNCGTYWNSNENLLMDNEWRQCDCCHQRGCHLCMPIRPAPHSGYWYQEDYEFICDKCYNIIEREHDDRRAAEFPELQQNEG